jgi:DNA invertase Pin-like site-specific DNA recombinase
MAQASKEATREAQKVGIAHAKQSGGYLGRKPTYNLAQLEQALTLKSDGMPITSIAKNLGLSRQTIYRIHSDPAEAMRIVTQWKAA